MLTPLLALLAALAPEPKTPKLLFIGIDGLRPDALVAARAPNLQRLIREGRFTPDASTCEHTISGAGWSNLLTGVWPDKHGSIDNKFENTHYERYPHFFARVAAAKPELELVHCVSWLPIDEKILGELKIAVREKHDWEKDDGDAQDAALSAKAISEGRADLVFCYFGDVDETGHEHGFSPYGAQYMAEIAQTDGLVGTLLDAIGKRKTRAGEDWLVVVSTDHGGTLDGAHGRNELAHRTIPVIAWGDSVEAGRMWNTTNQVDLVPTILRHLKIAIDPAWGLEGRPLQLAPDEDLLGRNLIWNGGAEAAPGTRAQKIDDTLPGWRDWDTLCALEYGAEKGALTDATPGPKTHGKNFFCGGTAQHSEIEQRIDLAPISKEIDAGAIVATASGWFGGYAEQRDLAWMQVQFLDEFGGVVGELQAGPVTVEERRKAFDGAGELMTGLVERKADALVPRATRRARVKLVCEAGEGANDGYADELSLTLKAR
jgi:hypothetical protein